MKIEFSKKEIYLKDIKNVEKVIKSGWLPMEFLQKNLKMSLKNLQTQSIA